MLTKYFKEFVALLHLHGVEYLVVGGYAIAEHGRLAIQSRLAYDGLSINFMGIDALKATKRASGGARYLDGLEQLDDCAINRRRFRVASPLPQTLLPMLQ